MERSAVIFGNKMPAKVYEKAVKSKQKFIKKYGDDSNVHYELRASETPVIGKELGVVNLKVANPENPADKSIPGTKPEFNEKSVIIGNIRMGFGHYRISMAIASAARAMGYEPFWFDLCSFQNTTCGKIISGQNDLYSMGSRLSQKSGIFNKLYWEPLNSEGFRQLSYNCADQKNAELMAPVCADLPKDIPYIATHVWPAQAAVHAGLTHVVNAIPDNWPMALHLAEGSIHTIQTPSAYLGYRMLRGMDKDRPLLPMDYDSLVYTGHYVDDELVRNIEVDCAARRERAMSGKPRRYLMSVGGAGAQKEIFAAIIKKLLPEIKAGKALLFVNVGDHMKVWEGLKKEIPEIGTIAKEHFNNWERCSRFIDEVQNGRSISGLHVFCHDDIFAAVYSTNLLMRVSDVLITKPSELSFYPLPKLMIKRVGGHEAWGAIRSAEVGDGTFECETVNATVSMIDLIQNSPEIICEMCDRIEEANKIGIYNGAYKVVELAVKGQREVK